MFCQECGNELPDGTKFCGKCGAKQIFINEKNIRNKKETMINILDKKVIIAVMVILVIFIIFIVTGGRSFKKTYNEYIDAMIDGDSKKIVDLVHPSYINYLIENNKIRNKKDLIQRVQGKLDWYAQSAESRSEDKTYKYLPELRNISDMDESALPFYEITYGKDKVKKAKKVNIYYIVYSQYHEELHTVHTELISFVKIGRKWYVGEIEDIEYFG